MLRWLPKTLVLLYQLITSPKPYARKPRRPPQPIEPPQPLCGSDRKLRLDIVYDAFCEQRPPPRRLFRNPQAPRDFYSWCDEPHRTTGRKRQRCANCEHARRLYFAAAAGDEHAERTLHTLARRATVRLTAERAQYRQARRVTLAAKREQRERFGPGPEPGNFHELQLWRIGRPSGAGAHHIHERREAEKGLLKDHARHLLAMFRRRRERLHVLALQRRRLGKGLSPSAVMAGPRDWPVASPRTSLTPAIHGCQTVADESKSWMTGTSPVMTKEGTQPHPYHEPQPAAASSCAERPLTPSAPPAPCAPA